MKCFRCNSDIVMMKEDECFGHGSFGNSYYFQCNKCLIRTVAIDNYRMNEQDIKEKLIEIWKGIK